MDKYGPTKGYLGSFRGNYNDEYLNLSADRICDLDGRDLRDRSQTLVRGGPDAKKFYRENFSGPPFQTSKNFRAPPFYYENYGSTP